MSALGKPSLSTRGPFIPTSPCWGERRGVEGRGGEWREGEGSERKGRRKERGGTSRGRDKWHRRTFVSLHSVATYSLNSRHLKNHVPTTWCSWGVKLRANICSQLKEMGSGSAHGQCQNHFRLCTTRTDRIKLRQSFSVFFQFFCPEFW